MGIVRVLKIKTEDNQEVVIHEPLGTAVGVVTLTVYDADNNQIAETDIDKETWERVKHGD